LTAKKDWKPAFLEKYSETGNISAATGHAEVSRTAFYKAKKNSQTFADKVEAAKMEAGDNLEGVAFQRAQKTSDTLLIFLLKGLKPETYGDRVRNEHSGPGGAPVTIRIVEDG